MDAIQLSPQMLNTIAKVRRRIDDTSTPPLYSDLDIYGYISDAVDELESTNYHKGIYVEDGDFSSPISNTDQSIYALRAAIIVLQGIKSRTDRDNFALRKQNLTVDTSGQSSDLAVTIKLLSDELEKSISNSIFLASFKAGFRIE